MFDREVAQLNSLMVIAEFSMRRIHSIRKQLRDEPDCGLGGKLEAYLSDLKKIQTRMRTIHQHMVTKEALIATLTHPN